jgi:hypothetical protein
MKKTILLFCLIALNCSIAPYSSAQLFVGSDDFDSGSLSKWPFVYRLLGSGTANGALSFTNSRLDFSKGVNEGSRFLRWDGDGAGSANRTSASFTTSWVAELTVTNTLTFASTEFGTIGLQIVGTSNQYSAIMLGSNSSGFFLRSEGSGTQSAFTSVNATTADSTDVRLRLSWDAGTTALTASYSFDSGASFTSIAAASPTSNWTAGTATSGFFFDVFGNSNAIPAITSGSMFADNFSVSAIPEPSTYAAMAGAAALGLAFWRRRKSRNATKI